MALLQLSPTLRTIPGVPGFFGSRLVNSGKGIILFADENGNGTVRIRNIAQTTNEGYSLTRVLHYCRQQFRRILPGLPVLNYPAVVIPAIEDQPESYQLVTFGDRCLVAYSSYFIAVFNARFGTWFMVAVAVERGIFHPINLGVSEKIAVDLRWNGLGLTWSGMVNIDELQPPDREIPRFLFTGRITADPADLTNFWIGGSNDTRLYTSNGWHIYSFKEIRGDWSWRIENCVADHGQCPFLHLKHSTMPSGWFMLVSPTNDMFQ